jgi:protein-tyrosine phosphatase
LKAFAQGGSLTVLMICMGNICRSPTAEGVLRSKLVQAGLQSQVVVDSAGTHAWHRGEPPDPRSIAHAQKRGYDLTGLRARPVTRVDFESCDVILAMDWNNLELLQDQCPPTHRTKIGRLSQYAQRYADPVIPDPYEGGSAGFDHVLNLVEDACDGFVEFLLQKRNEASRGTS